jgi:hypothetical protein
MADDRTEEAKKADAELAVAIHNAISVRFPENRMLLDFVVLAQREDPDKPGQSQYNYLLADGSMPWHRILGLMQVVGTLMKSELADGTWDAEDE